MSAGVADLPCRELVELATDYLEGRLSAEERVRFEAHLALCDGCTTYLEQLRQVIRAAGKLEDESLDVGARDTLLAAFRDWKRSGGSGP
jgi:anti-sigma factor RsiW